MCDSCLTAMQFPDLTKRQYSMGCAWCGARYLRDGGQHIGDWERLGISAREAHALRAEGQFIDPELKRRKS